MRQDQPKSSPDFPLTEIALSLLRKGTVGREPMAFCREGPAGLAMGIDVLLLSGHPPAPALRRLLGLAQSLAGRCGSPRAAAAIERAVRSHPKAMQALGGRRSAAAAQRAAARFTGAGRSLTAPVHGAAVPAGAMPVSTLGDRLQVIRPSATRALARPGPPANPPKQAETQVRRGAARKTLH